MNISRSLDFEKKTLITSRKFNSQSGGIIAPLVILLVLSLVASGVFLYLFATNVPPGFMGLRQTFYAPKKELLGIKAGFSSKGLEPGLHWSIPGVSEITLIPTSMRILKLDGKDSLTVTSREGSVIDVDVSIITRINAKPVYENGKKVLGGPADLVKKLSKDNSKRWDQEIINAVEERLLRSLSTLSASEFYNPDLREPVVKKAEDQIRNSLKKFGIVLEAVLIRFYDYEREEIEQAIFAKNLQDQEEQLNRRLSELAKARAELAEEEERLTYEIKLVQTKGKEKAKSINSEAELIEARLTAEGDRLVSITTAEVEEMKAKLLKDNKSASVLIAEQMAPLLSSLKGGIVSGVDPYNVDEWINRFGVSDTKVKPNN